MPDQITQWPSGIRDTTEFPTVDINVSTSTRDHLRAFCEMEGVGWNDYRGQAGTGGYNATDSRLRTYRKLYERLGLIYNDNDVIKLSKLGKELQGMEAALISDRDEMFDEMRSRAIEILSRYQLKNPIDGPDLPDSCDVRPYFCIWKAMYKLDNKINYEEMNRVILRIPSMAKLDIAIETIRNARTTYGNYSNIEASELDTILGEPVHRDQPTARIAPWFSIAGWGGLIIEQQLDTDGYHHLVDRAIPYIALIMRNPPEFYLSDNKDSWRAYYIGNSVINDENEPGYNYVTGYRSRFSRNRILFGAPGTGKSFTVNEEKDQLMAEGGEYERVTFHPDYSYANFVGTYKPVPYKDDTGKDSITYEYVPGPFMRTYVKALKAGKSDNPKPVLLIIEEINRANVAAVFGDVFQLLDRDDDNASEYPIQASEDIKRFLAKPDQLGGVPEDYSQIRIPDNMFIWATMNSADQGVFPMDTAFKRRWDFTYLGINDNEELLIGKTVLLGSLPTVQKIEWNRLRKAINKFLAENNINEDKQLGPFFIAKNIVVPEQGDVIDRDKFIHTFKNKVIMYLFEDAAKQKRSLLFSGCFENKNRYSEICKEFDLKGIGIFPETIHTDAEPVKDYRTEEDLMAEGLDPEDFKIDI